jgi:hypothetical protein
MKKLALFAFALPIVCLAAPKFPRGTITLKEKVNVSFNENLADRLSDRGRGELQWSLVAAPSWVHIDENTGALSGTAPAAGETQFDVMVKDQDGLELAPIMINVER